MSRRITLCLLVTLLAYATPVLAANVTVSGDSPHGAITVTVEDATADVVLEKIRQKFGFEVGGLENARDGDALTGTMSGDLQAILERLLRNRNHLIVRSPDAESGIAKVMILEPPHGGTQARAEEKSGSASGPGKFLQAYSGGGTGNPGETRHIPGKHPDE